MDSFLSLIYCELFDSHLIHGKKICGSYKIEIFLQNCVKYVVVQLENYLLVNYFFLE